MSSSVSAALSASAEQHHGDTTRLDHFLARTSASQTDKFQRAFAAARTYLGKFRGRYLPLGQSMQVMMLMAPLVSEYFPMSHV